MPSFRGAAEGRDPGIHKFRPKPPASGEREGLDG
jgi:hypothetical protein